MAKTYFERRSFRLALEHFLTDHGWVGSNAPTYAEGFQSDDAITTPLVAITLVRPTNMALQLGNGEKLFRRIFQVDCYMETEPRAMAITDDICEFMDVVPMNINDNQSNILGTLICQDTESIYSEILPPILNSPKVIRWRGVARGTYDAFYPTG
jgi:hypothetical protein